jgi:hypothetical protein
VARIDAPLLDSLVITIYHQLIFDTSQLTQLISHTPKFKAYHDEAHVVLTIGRFGSHLHRWVAERSACKFHADSQIGSFRLSRSLAQISARLSLILSFTQWSTSTPMVDVGHRIGKRPQDDIESSQWLEQQIPLPERSEADSMGLDSDLTKIPFYNPIKCLIRFNPNICVSGWIPVMD